MSPCSSASFLVLSAKLRVRFLESDFSFPLSVGLFIEKVSYPCMILGIHENGAVSFKYLNSGIKLAIKDVKTRELTLQYGGIWHCMNALIKQVNFIFVTLATHSYKPMNIVSTQKFLLDLLSLRLSSQRHLLPVCIAAFHFVLTSLSSLDHWGRIASTI